MVTLLINHMFQLKNSLALILASAVTFALALLASSYLTKTSSEVDVGTRQGFDFGFAADEKLDWVGPKVGDRINLSRLSTQDGETLADLAGNNLVMLVLVDPECGACKAASDEMRDVQNRIARAGIGYYPASVTARQSPSEFLEYTQSLGIRGPALLWQEQDESPPASLFGMVLPSHLLLDNSGVIVRKWPGTDKSPQVRRRMANQIVADTVEELKLRTRAAQFQTAAYQQMSRQNLDQVSV